MSKKKPPQKHRKHTAEFKAEAIKLADHVGVAEAAEKLGVYASQIYSWRTALGNTRSLSERESQQATEIYAYVQPCFFAKTDGACFECIAKWVLPMA
jgi:transposase